MKHFIFILSLVFSFVTKADLDVYKDTDNTGLNKKERIDSIEKYLIDLSKNVKSLESKFDENAKKIKQLDDDLKKIKMELPKDQLNKIGESSESLKNNPEINKLRTDFENFRARDFERLKNDFNVLSESLIKLQRK